MFEEKILKCKKCKKGKIGIIEVSNKGIIYFGCSKCKKNGGAK